MKKKPRPLFNKNITELEQLFSEASENIKQLREIYRELKKRNTPRALDLKKKIDLIINVERPLFNATLDELRAIFENEQYDEAKLKILEAELKFRNSPGAIALRQQIQNP